MMVITSPGRRGMVETRQPGAKLVRVQIAPGCWMQMDEAEAQRRGWLPLVEPKELPSVEAKKLPPARNKKRQPGKNKGS